MMSLTPHLIRKRETLGVIWMPAPISPNSAAASRTVTFALAQAIAMAAVRLPNPAPTSSMWSFCTRSAIVRNGDRVCAEGIINGLMPRSPRPCRGRPAVNAVHERKKKAGISQRQVTHQWQDDRHAPNFSTITRLKASAEWRFLFL